jgi:hypothetical protein
LSPRAPVAAHDGFTDWLRGPQGRAAAQDLGWQGDPADQPPQVSALASATDAYRSTRSTARVVLTVDASLSMRTSWADVRRTADAVAAQLGPGDQVGLESFVAVPPDAGRSVTRVPVSEIGEGAGQDPRAALRAQLDTLALHLQDGDTPAGVALATAIDRVRPLQDATAPKARSTVVMITDGTDIVQPLDWQALQRRAAEERVDVLVVVLGARSGLLAGIPAEGPFQGLQVLGGDPGEQVLRQLAGLLWRAEP